MLHSQILPKDNHPFYTWQSANAAARLADNASKVTTDIGKIAWDVDTNAFWILTNVTPVTWVALITASAGASPDDGTVGPIVGDITGHAGSATAADNAERLSTPRTIALVGDVVGTATFDGSTNIQITTTTTADAVTLGIDTNGDYVASSEVTGNGLTGNATGEGSVFTVNSNATPNNTPDTIVYRDSEGGFSAGTITAAEFVGSMVGNTIGNADTATKWTTPRTLTVNGDSTGSVTLDGSADVTLTLTANKADSIHLGVDTVGNYIATASVAGNGLSGIAANGEGSTFTVTSNATTSNVPSTIVYRNASGNFSAGTITADQFIGPITGTVTAASRLATARVIALTGAVTGETTFDGSANVAINTTFNIQPNSVILGTDTVGNYVSDIYAGAGVTINGGNAAGATPTISIGQAVGTSDSPTFADLTVSGNLTVLGTTTTIDSINTSMKDVILQLASGNSTGAAPYIGIQAERGAMDAYWIWDEANTTWKSAISPDGVAFAAAAITASTVTATSFVGDGSSLTNISASNITGMPAGSLTLGTTSVALGTTATVLAGLSSVASTSFVGALTGNATTADTATTLQTSRLINGVGFDGSADIAFFDTFTNSVPSPGPQTFPSNSIRGFDAYLSTDFPSSYFTGLTVSGPSGVRSGQLAMNWNSEELAPSGIYFRTNDDTNTPNQWSAWQRIATAADLTSAGGTYVSKAGDTMSGDLTINGALSATTKNFLIDHPTKAGMQLRHGSLEGPENGVYVRGKTQTSVIELPEYWTKLVDPETITVSLTAIGKSQNLLVAGTWNNKVYIINEDGDGSINCFYHIFAERIDVAKLQVEVLTKDE